MKKDVETDSSTELFKMAVKKVRVALIISNLRKEKQSLQKEED